MSRDVLTIGSTMRISLLYRGEYSQWVERFMNYLEEQTDGGSNDQFNQECNKTAKDLWDALARHMLGSEYGEQDRKAAKCGYSKDNCELNFKFLNNLQPEWKQYATMMRQNKNLMDINIDALYNILKQNQGDVNDAMGSKKKNVVVTSDPLALIAKKTNVSRSKEKGVVSSDSEGSEFGPGDKCKHEFIKTDNKRVEKKDDEKKRDMSRVKCYNCKKERHFAKDCKKEKVKDYEYYKTKMLLAKKDKDEQILLAEDQAWMESSSDSDQEINANMLKDLIEKNNDLLAQTKVLKDQLQVKHVVIDTHVECQKIYAKLEAERYEYMIRYSAYFGNDKQHKKQIADQQILYDKMSVQLVKLDKHVRDFKNTVLDKDFKISELEECVRNKDLEIEKCLERLNWFKNPRYFEKAKDLRPTLYDEKVIGLGYTQMFLTHSDEALEIKKFKRSRENKIEFAYDYGNLNASYQTSSLKPYIPNVILEKIIIDLEDEVVNLLEKEKVNLETIESLKSKGFESSETVSKSENQNENDCQKIEKVCDKEENPKVIATDLDTFSGVRRPKNSGVIWKKKGSSNTSNVGLSAVSVSTLNKNVKRYSRKDLLACNNSHLGETTSASVCNDAMSVSCNPRMCDLLDDNNFFIFDDVNIVQICLCIIDSGCSKHMTGNRTLLTNFVEKFLGTVRFGNNDFAVIAGYGDVVIGSMMIKKVIMSNV
nr:integrase, catalytic region, zinc finger, CCHC-type, peptidase aspartic, catalytic [Tanacetum cinerariifolium]